MADTKIAQVAPELVMKYWAKTTWKAGVEDTFFNKFMGKSASDCIHIKEELAKGPGDSINIPLLMALKGPGVLEDNWMEGNEEQLVYRSFDVGISRVRNAVRLEGKFDEHKTQINMRRDAKDSLSAWLTDWIDNALFGVLTGVLPENFTSAAQFPFELKAPTADRVVYGGGQSAEADITPADKFTPDMIGICKRKAIEDKHKRMRPLRDGGRDLMVPVNPFLYSLCLNEHGINFDLSPSMAKLVLDEDGKLKPFEKFTVWCYREAKSFLVDEETRIFYKDQELVEPFKDCPCILPESKDRLGLMLHLSCHHPLHD